MDSKNIIMQGERAQYLMESSLPNFSFESNDYILEIIYGMADEKIVIEKKDVTDGVFSFSTSGIVGQLTARLVMIIIDPDCPDEIRQEVDKQIIGFVTTTPCTCLHECPACICEHGIKYTYLQ